jgi:N-acetylmuramoyl-L-alanine amidase
MTARFLTRITAVALAGALLFALAPEADAKSSHHKKRHRSKANNSATPSTVQPRTPVSFSTVVVDAGHGGHDRGGIPENIIPEKEVALDVARRLQSHLESEGLRVVMTRSDDTFVTLGQRVRIANAEPNAIFISVHFNAALRSEARGVETFFGSASGAPLARLIQEKLLTITANPESRPLKRAKFWVLRETKCPAVLTECGFLTNPEDAAFAQQESSREMLAQQIAAAVLEHRNSLAGGN